MFLSSLLSALSSPYRPIQKTALSDYDKYEVNMEMHARKCGKMPALANQDMDTYDEDNFHQTQPRV